MSNKLLGLSFLLSNCLMEKKKNPLFLNLIVLPKQGYTLE